jgi:hypothetical protein
VKNIFSKCLSLLLAVLLTQTTVPTIAQTAEVDLDDESRAADSERVWKEVREGAKLARRINLMGYLHWICSRSIEYGNEGNDLELKIYFAVSDYEFGSDRTVRAVMSEKEYEALLKRTVREEDLLGFPKGDVSVSFYFDADRELSDTDMINIMDILTEDVRYDQEKLNIDEVHKTLKKSSISNDEKMKLVYLTMANIVIDEFGLTDEYGLGLLDVLKKRGKITVDNKLYSDRNIYIEAMEGEIEPSPVTGMIDEFVKDKPKTKREIDEFVTSIMEGELYFEYFPIPRRYVKKYYDRLIRARINGEEIDPFLLNPAALESEEVFGDDDEYAVDLLSLLKIELPIVLLGLVVLYVLRKKRTGKSRAQKKLILL